MKIQNTNTVSLYSLSKSERLFIEHQGKAMDRTIQYCHYYHCNRQENKDREDDKDAKGLNEAEGVFEESKQDIPGSPYGSASSLAFLMIFNTMNHRIPFV